jgi:hypothetical protein
MLIMIFKWWYGTGWATAFKNIKTHTAGVSRSFSIPILLRTLFAPWRRVISYPGRTLEDHFRALLDNVISRLVGFVVRLMVLLAAGVLTLLTVLGYGLLAVVWPLIPLVIIYCIVRGVIG